MSSESTGSVSIHWIDPVDGRSLQSWTFDDQRITIGRGTGESIPLSDPYVSRLHAEVLHRDGKWCLIAHGRNGVLVDGRPVTEEALSHGATFRLGLQGPMFRFDAHQVESAQATLSFDESALMLLTMNRQEVESEASEIAESDFFRQLRNKARQLRQARRGSP